MRKVPARTARIVEGYYVGKDYVHGGDEVNCIMQVVADANDSTMIHIHNFYGLEETVDAVVDVNTGALTILPQRIWQSESYGDVYMFPISYVGDRVQYFPTQPVPGTIDADGVIRLGQWAAIVGQGAAAGIFGSGAMPIAKVSHAVNFGNVTLSRVVPEKGFGAGGIWGGYGPVDISECYNYGTVSAPDWAAGINPAMHSNGNGGSSIVRCYNAGKVVATSDTASHVANIALISHYVDTRNPIDPTLMHTDSVYFDNEVCTAFAGDTIGKGLTRVELLTAPLGDAFTYRPACLPTLSFMDSVAVASFHAAHILLNEGDSFDNVNKSFRVGMMLRAQ